MVLVLLIFALICLFSGLLFRILGDIAIAILGAVMCIDGLVLLGIVILLLIF